jgi:hypothetical protein
MSIDDFRQVWDAERRYMRSLGQQFCAELRRHEDTMRAQLPALRAAFRATGSRRSGANDN